MAENIRPKQSDELSELSGCETDVLDCSELPTGTHKYYKAQRAMRLLEGIDWTPILISSGNYAKAIAREATKVRRKVIVVLDKSSSAYRPIESEFVEEVEINDLVAANVALAKREDRPRDPKNLEGCALEAAYEYYCDPNQPLTRYKFSTGVTDQNRHTPVNVTNLTDLDHIDIFKHNGIPSDHLLDTYGRLAATISDYDTVLCPVGSGELFYDLFSYSPGTSVDFYGVHPERHPALIREDFVELESPSLADKLTTPVFPIKHDFYPYDNGHFSIPGFILERAEKMKKTYSFLSITEEEIAKANQVSLACGFNAEHSGSVGFAATLDSFRERHGVTFSAGDRVLIVSTGNGE